MEINKNYNENCLDTMAKMKDNFIDLTVTSPPYDNLRTYNGYSFDFENVAKELFRTTKDGGIVIWVVGDATVKGSETGTSFRQALYFMECGFKLHDTMIFKSAKPPLTHKRYEQEFEYMFVFVKGKINTFNGIKRKAKTEGGSSGSFMHNNNAKFKKANTTKKTPKEVLKGNIFEYKTGYTRNGHPAVFPEQLANDHIISWSDEDDLVYDPFMGSGTTAKMAIINKRNWIGSEMSSEYCEIIKERVKNIQP